MYLQTFSTHTRLTRVIERQIVKPRNYYLSRNSVHKFTALQVVFLTISNSHQKQGKMFYITSETLLLTLV